MRLDTESNGDRHEHPFPLRISAALSAEYRARMMSVSHQVNFEEGARIFIEGGRADRFWIVRTGTVTLDVLVPGSKPHGDRESRCR